MLAQTKSRHVLIVEDEIFTQRLICEIISKLGYVCSCATTVSEALSVIKSSSPDLVITDLDLGDGPTGLDLINKLNRDYPDTAIAVLTAHTSPTLVDSKFTELPDNIQYIVKSQLNASNSFETILKNAFEKNATNKIINFEPKNAIYLSKIQAELLKLMAQGFSNQAIADKRGTSLRAVEALINRTYQALNLKENDSINLRVEAVKLWKSSNIHVK